MNWDLITTRDGDGGGSTTTAPYRWPPTASWRPSEAAFPPLRLLPSSSPLRYPRVSAHEAPPVRPERHHPTSIATQRRVTAPLLGPDPALLSRLWGQWLTVRSAVFMTQ